MSEWKKVKLGEIGKIITGKTPPTKDKDNYGGNIPFITPVDMVGNKNVFITERYLTEKGKNIVKNCLLPANTICVSCIGSDMGKAVITTQPSITNQQINSIIVNDAHDFRFVFYLMLTQTDVIKSLGKNSTAVPILNKSKFCNIEVYLPSLSTQHRIATILSRYDSLIENYQKQIKLLEEAAQRLYKEWFVDLHFPGHENTKIVDGVPEGWEKKKLGEILDYYDKQRKPLSSMQRMGMVKIYPYYGAATLMDYVDNYLFDGIYLLLGEDGTVITPDNYPVLQYVWGKFWVNNHAHVLRGKNGISTEYLYSMFKEMPIADVVTGAAQPKISQGRLSEKKIVVPPTNLITKWSETTKAYFDSLRNHTEEIRLLTEARDRLLPKLMSGEIDV